MRRGLRLAAVAAALALVALRVLAPALAAGGVVDAVVTDDRGQPVADAVVSLAAVGRTVPARPAAAIMDQQNREFVPHVLPVVVGTPVRFPNRDNIRHHVYSFSPAKRFELPLYIGTPSAPVVFNKPGVVVLGCNIHDWMLGYIYVLATPYFAKTGDDGRARVTDLPPGAWEARVWHPRMRGETEKTGQPVSLTGGEGARLTFAVALKPERRLQQPARPGYDRQQGG